VQLLSPKALVELFKSYRYQIGSEIDLQRGLEQVLSQHGIAFCREYSLQPDYGRIDFYLPDYKCGVELKVKGAPSEVLRQLYRYAQSPDISALILITTRARLAIAPQNLNQKPLLTASLWETQLR